MTAETRPIVRKVVSGEAIALSIARLAWPGKAANSSPSMTKTSPTAAMKSDTAPKPYGVGRAVDAGAWVWSFSFPAGSVKKRKKSRSGLSTMRVSPGRRPLS